VILFGCNFSDFENVPFVENWRVDFERYEKKSIQKSKLLYKKRTLPGSELVEVT
jgi:hypothetical protein